MRLRCLRLHHEGVYRQRFQRDQRHAQLARLATALEVTVIVRAIRRRRRGLYGGDHHGAVSTHGRRVGRHLRAHEIRTPATQRQENDQEEDEKAAHRAMITVAVRKRFLTLPQLKAKSCESSMLFI